jgi:hypothetical protein
VICSSDQFDFLAPSPYAALLIDTKMINHICHGLTRIAEGNAVDYAVCEPARESVAHDRGEGIK